MKTRNSIYTTSMENSFTSDSDESILDKEYEIDNYDTDTDTDNYNENENDNENENETKMQLNKRGLPKRKTTLKLENIKEELLSTDEDDEDFDINNFNKNIHDDTQYNKLFKSNTKKHKIFNSMEEEKYFAKLSSQKQDELLNIKNEITQEENIQKPILFKILELDVDKPTKISLYKKYKDLENLESSSNEYYKLKSYIDNLLNIPFGTYEKLTTNNVCDYITLSKHKLDNVIYGQEPVKMHILEIISQYFSNQNCLGNIFGVYGPMGVGKTTIIKEGLSQVLQRPFSFISLGGAQDSSFLDGHSYTYEGSTHGKIADCLIKSKCMNPIIYFDELDKLSNTAKGEEISNLLIHITDESQNTNFQDKYFNGVNIDLSKCIFVFSFNDPENINKILRDRIQLINLNGFTKQEKLKICKKFLIPNILKEFNLTNIIFKDDALVFLIDEYSKEEGVRNLKHIIKKIISKINLIKCCNSKDINKQKIRVKFPLNISQIFVKKLLEIK
jgi:ATP-dependent Lon protease